jgi:serine/threonine protein kinase
MDLVSKLNHPAFISILDVVSFDDGIAILKPMIAGRSLLEQVRQSGRMDPRAAAELVAALAEALQRAHELGLVHGNLVPAKVLLGDDGRPRLLGLETALLTREQAQENRIVGSPTDMPLEAIRGEGDGCDPRRDVYALGAVLYVALTGEPPLSAEPAPRLIEQILNDRPKAPRRIVRSIPAALEAICLKAMAKDPLERYATAAELAIALRDFLKPRRRSGFWK